MSYNLLFRLIVVNIHKKQNYTTEKKSSLNFTEIVNTAKPKKK